MKKKINHRINMGHFPIKILPLILLGLNAIFMPINPDAYMGVADYFIFFALFVCVAFLLKSKVVINNESKCILILFICLFVGVVITALQGIFSSGYFLSYVLYLTTMIFLVNMEYSAEEIKCFTYIYIIGAVITSIILFVQRIDFYGSGDTRHTIKILTHDAFDPNFLAAFLVVPAIITFASIIYNFEMRTLVFFLVIVGGILYTASRGALLAMMLGMFVVVLGLIKADKKTKHFCILGLMVLAGGIMILRFIPMNSLLRLIDINAVHDRSNTKRFLDWKYGLQAFLKRPVIGYGIQGELSIIKRSLGVNFISHNTFIAFLLQFGVLGFGIIVVTFAKLIKGVTKDSVAVSVLISTVIVSFFVSAEVTLFFWIPLMLLIIVAKYNRDSHTTKEWLI